jgi:abequosyltransferase
VGDPRLSICIPTYNFGEFIGETLESILGAHCACEVEIIVGDGGSTDNTAEVVERFRPHCSRLTYRNFGKKGGIDLDLSKTVELAKADYCWLMSSDDVVRPGALQRVLDEITLGHAVYLFNRTICSRSMRPTRRKSSWLANGTEDTVYHFTDRSELVTYLNASESIGALFSYLSSIVVSRRRWCATGFDQRFDGSNYAHVFRLFSILKVGGTSFKYIKQPLVACRWDNDSFMDKGLAHRVRIDFEGYRLLVEALFLDDEIRNACKAVMRRQHRWYNLSRLKCEVDDHREWKEIENTLSDYGYGHGELFLINMLGSSKLLVNSLRSVRNFLLT